MKEILIIWEFKPLKNNTYKRGSVEAVLWKGIEFVTIHTKSQKQTFASKETLNNFLLKLFKPHLGSDDPTPGSSELF
jgi:hypothetical protein